MSDPNDPFSNTCAAWIMLSLSHSSDWRIFLSLKNNPRSEIQNSESGLPTEEALTGLPTEDVATSFIIGLEEERTDLRSDEAGVFESFELVITCGLPKEILMHVISIHSTHNELLTIFFLLDIMTDSMYFTTECSMQH